VDCVQPGEGLVGQREFGRHQILMQVGFPSAMSIKLGTGQPGPDHRAAALASFTRLAADTLRILAVEWASFRTAARFADQPTLNLGAGDALHLAICAEWGATLCTLDRRLGEAAPVVGVGSVLL
jgi:uncharacterized protein